MAAKRALIVDDSRSARVILSRMLEAFGLTVDTSESAELALEYLRQHRPDVIFMDHLMPGMDGFAAVRLIKGNPQTAMIPVLMYTSQEGDMYMSQARALGAVGVVPKTVKQVDVSRVLYQLHLLPERREGATQPPVESTVEHIGPEPTQSDAPTSAPIDSEASLRTAIPQLFKEHQNEMRRLLLSNFEHFERRLVIDLKGVDTPATPSPLPADETSAAAAPPSSWNSPWLKVAAVVLLALLPLMVLGAAYLRTLAVNEQLTSANSRLTATLAEQQKLMAASKASADDAALVAQQGQEPYHGPVLQATEPVPYGEAPLSGARTERLRTLLDRLKNEGFQGVLRVQSYVGDFCLAASGAEGYSIASDDVLVRRCDVVGNPFEDSLSGAQRQSIGFANLLATLTRQAAGIKVEVGSAGRRPLEPYPYKSDKLTAGEWNRVAVRNNRVEFVAEPAS